VENDSSSVVDEDDAEEEEEDGVLDASIQIQLFDVSVKEDGAIVVVVV
jgi:hypothetical protein